MRFFFLFFLATLATPLWKRESTETIVAEAAKLDVLVDEVLAYIKDARHG